MLPMSALLSSALIQGLMAENPASPGLNLHWSRVLSGGNFYLHIADFSWDRLLAEHPDITPHEVRYALAQKIGSFAIVPTEGRYSDQPDCHKAEAQLAEHLNFKYLHQFYDLLSILALLPKSESSSTITNYGGDDQGDMEKSSLPSYPLGPGGGHGIMAGMSATASKLKESTPSSSTENILDRQNPYSSGHSVAQIFSFASTNVPFELGDSIGNIASIELEQLFTNSPQTIFPLSGPRQVASPLITSVPIEPQIPQLMPQPRGFESIQQTVLPIVAIYSASTDINITTPKRVSELVNVSNQSESGTPTPIPFVPPSPLPDLKEEITNPVLNIDGSNSGGQILIPLNVGTVEITSFTGVGRGTNPDPRLIPTIDTIQFIGPGLIAKYLQMEQKGQDVILSFEGNDRTEVILKNIALDTIDNLDDRTNTPLRMGNILFDGDKTIKDSFDVVNSDWYQNAVLNLNTTTFLNDLDNFVYGFDHSDDVINGQGGNDTLFGLGGDDILRGGSGNDILIGGLGQNQLVGNTGQDVFVISSGGISDVMDFTLGGDKIGLSKGMVYSSLQFVAFTDSCCGGTQIWQNNQLVMNILGIRPDQMTSAQFTPWQQEFKLP